MSQVKASVLALAFNLVHYSPELDKDGNKVVRASYPTLHYSGFKSLKEKLLKNVEVTVQEGDTAKTMTLDEYNAADPKPSVVSEKFVDGEVELGEKEKAALKFALSALDELPVIDKETEEGFKAWSGCEYGK